MPRAPLRGNFRAPLELTAGGSTGVNTCFLPAPPVILSRRRRISVPVVNGSAAGHARTRYAPSRPAGHSEPQAKNLGTCRE